MRKSASLKTELLTVFTSVHCVDFCGILNGILILKLRLKTFRLVIFLMCYCSLLGEVIYNLIVSTDNQTGKHKDRRKSSLDVRTVASRASEGR